MFSGPVFSAAVPTTVLVTVVSEFKTPQAIALPLKAENGDETILAHTDLFSLTSPPHDITTPPPRA